MGALKQLILCSQVKKSSNLTLGSATYPFEGPGGQPKLEKLYILMMDFEHSIRNLFSCATNKCNMSFETFSTSNSDAITSPTFTKLTRA